MDGLTFNTDVSTYTLDELFSMLDIKITDTSDVVSIKQLITERTNQYIRQFTEANRDNMTEFFKRVQQTLLGQTDAESTTSQKNIIIHTQGSSTDLYNSSNGSGNPIHRKTITQLLNVDSRFRQNYSRTTSTDYLIDLPYTIPNVIEIQLCDLELPTTYYPINDTLQNNYFWFSTYTLEQMATDTPTLYYIYVPSGNYFYENLIIFLNKSIQSLETKFPVSVSIDLSYNNPNGVGNGTGKCTVGIQSAEDILNNIAYKIVKVELNFDAPMIVGLEQSTKITDPERMSLYSSRDSLSTEPKLDWLGQRLSWMLGYRKGLYNEIASSTSGSNLYYRSESVVNILGPSYLFLVVNDFNQNKNKHFINSSRNGLLPNDIIARISIKAPVFNIQSQNDFSVYSETRNYFGPVKISKLQIQLVDEYARIVDLNQSDFSFTLRLTTIYSST